MPECKPTREESAIGLLRGIVHLHPSFGPRDPRYEGLVRLLDAARKLIATIDAPPTPRLWRAGGAAWLSVASPM